ncbi:hypothetical protein ABL78_8223 [Leptomonas seymouri]|uniref:Uncharacterized protein n=1 Tax=Leptomonas seymouri TaxID=5684 RepID=A0A0N1HRA9_LEPSE|nr:hypothetical protein ABL78_8223 [Leptomonas seymouri]|eukprot:KPI82765.1 hypothetical protein ABL78_8223 [Leptomonas seymouri]
MCLLYAVGSPPPEPVSERARRLQKPQRRQEEAELSKPLCADVLRRRLQEQVAIGRPSFRKAATRDHCGVGAAGLSASEADVAAAFTPAAAPTPLLAGCDRFIEAHAAASSGAGRGRGLRRAAAEGRLSAACAAQRHPSQEEACRSAVMGSEE